MALSDTLKSAFLAAQNAADDTKTTFVYNDVTKGVYDPATDSYTDTVSQTTLSRFMYGLDERELDWFPADWEVQKVIIHRDDISAAPEDYDYITIGGVTWRINRIQTLPGNDFFKLYLVKS